MVCFLQTIVVLIRFFCVSKWIIFARKQLCAVQENMIFKGHTSHSRLRWALWNSCSQRESDRGCIILMLPYYHRTKHAYQQKFSFLHITYLHNFVLIRMKDLKLKMLLQQQNKRNGQDAAIDQEWTCAGSWTEHKCWVQPHLYLTCEQQSPTKSPQQSGVREVLTFLYGASSSASMSRSSAILLPVYRDTLTKMGIRRHEGMYPCTMLLFNKR